MVVFGDFNTSVTKALTEIDKKWESYPGLIVCGTHSPEEHDVEHQINEIRDAREKGIPYLGICFGHQLAAIEWARNVGGIPDATSEEFDEKGTNVVKKLAKLKVGMYNGESYWHNYEVKIDWEKPANFFTAQYHPEYQSSKDKPHPLLVEFLQYAKMAV